MAKKNGFLLGALVGAAAALFFAPKKGSELREDAGKAYDEFKENPKETLNNWKDSAVGFSTEKFNEVKEKFDSGEISADKAKEYLIEKRDAIKAKVESGELSKESVVDFFNSTKTAISEKLNSAKETAEETAEEVAEKVVEEAPFDAEESTVAEDVVSAVTAAEEKLTTTIESVTNRVSEETGKVAENVEKTVEEANSESK